jgi:hypothetical protein
MDLTEKRAKAGELYAQALELESRKDYYGAYDLCEQSLKLYEDEKARDLYLRLMATIGPL